MAYYPSIPPYPHDPSEFSKFSRNQGSRIAAFFKAHRAKPLPQGPLGPELEQIKGNYNPSKETWEFDARARVREQRAGAAALQTAQAAERRAELMAGVIVDHAVAPEIEDLIRAQYPIPTQPPHPLESIQ